MDAIGRAEPLPMPSYGPRKGLWSSLTRAAFIFEMSASAFARIRGGTVQWTTSRTRVLVGDRTTKVRVRGGQVGVGAGLVKTTRLSHLLHVSRWSRTAGRTFSSQTCDSALPTLTLRRTTLTSDWAS